MEPMDAFIDDDGGYTSLSVALSLLLSLTLAFGAAAAGWMMARSSEVQEVADASALAAEQVVARYSTVAQVSDACVLSMWLTGVLVLWAGLVASAIPGAGTVASAIVDAGTKVLDARRDFAKSAAEGLSGLERALPTLIVLSSYDVVEANESDGISYGGCAIPYPLESASEFDLADDVDPAELVESSERLQKASERAREAKERADAALLAGWEADCGGEPRSLQERAATLARLDEAENPDYPTPEGWNFGVTLSRSRAYYAARLADETPEGSGIEPQTDSALRERFYAYALGEMRSGHYRELPDGSVDMSLPRLPHNTDETRGTKLYTERVWTCTQEPEGLVIHSTASCPGASGPKAGLESLQAIDAGRAHECRVCKLDVGEMGRVAAASTSIDNGYEHYWREVVDAADAYQQATDELADAQREMREIGEEGDSAFEEALEQLKVERPRLCPPGSYGCVAVVRRESGTQVPSVLTSGWIAPGELPGGMAVSAATLAPDEETQENDVLSRFFDALSEQGGVAGVANAVCSMWGRLLVGYGSAYESVATTADDLLGKIDSGLGTSIGSWLRDLVSQTVHDIGFEPVDMRLRKPVLANSEQVLSRAGVDDGEARRMVQAVPDEGTPEEVARSLGVQYLDEKGIDKVTIAEIAIPGTDISIPLTIDLRGLVAGDGS